MATNLNILKCNYTDAYEIVKTSLKLKLAILVHGAPGIGKSSMAQEIIRRKNNALKKKLTPSEYKKQKWSMIDIRLAQFPPEDMAGLPVPVEVTRDGKKEWVTMRSLPDYLPKSGNGILFLDEINQANPSVLAAVFQLILDRKMTNDYELPEGWSIMAACNDFKHNSDVTEFNAPINDRFIHIELEADAESWLNWAEKNGINEKITDYISNNHSALMSDDMNSNIVFASPRSWEKLSKFEDLYDAGSISMHLLTTTASGIIGLDNSTLYFNHTRSFRRDEDQYDFDAKPYIKSLEAGYKVEEYRSDEDANIDFARYVKLWNDMDEQTEAEDRRSIFHITRFYITHVSNNPEAVLAMWASLYSEELDGYTLTPEMMKSDYKKSWELLYPKE